MSTNLTKLGRIELVDDVRPSMGKVPAVIGVDTKYGHNAAAMLRLCSAFGYEQLWLTGTRWAEGWEKRMPREERMRAYQHIQVYRCDEPLRAFGPDVTPVAVEVMPQAQTLPYFEHPENAVYVFGPEDGSLPDWAKRNSHQHVIIPTMQCVNLACAVGMVMYDRKAKRIRDGLEENLPSYQLMNDDRGFIDGDEELAWLPG